MEPNWKELNRKRNHSLLFGIVLAFYLLSTDGNTEADSVTTIFPTIISSVDPSQSTTEVTTIEGTTTEVTTAEVTKIDVDGIIDQI